MRTRPLLWQPQCQAFPNSVVCACTCVRACVCEAQLLSRWNAHYAGDDNGVESEVRTTLALRSPPRILSPPPIFNSTGWVSVTLESLVQGLWRGESYLCLLGVTHRMHPAAQRWSSVGVEWASVNTFFTFFSPGLKGLFLSQRRRSVSKTRRPSCSRNAPFSQRGLLLTEVSFAASEY